MSRPDRAQRATDTAADRIGSQRARTVDRRKERKHAAAGTGAHRHLAAGAFPGHDDQSPGALGAARRIKGRAAASMDPLPLAGLGRFMAAAWSLGYGLLGPHWTGGAGFPFGTEHDPHAARVSILEHIQQQPAAPVIATGLGGAVLALVLARRRTRGPVGAALPGFAWTMAVALTVVIPDIRPLTGVARTPIVLVGLPFGWPPGGDPAQPVPVAGGQPVPAHRRWALWAALRGRPLPLDSKRLRPPRPQTRRHCSGWTTPASAARWGRWATAVAVTVPSCMP